MRMRVIAVALLCAAAASAADQSAGPGPAPRSMSAERLVSKIHQTNQMEIQLGRLAQRKGSTGSVKRYGLLLERDHRLGDKDAMNVAADENLRVEALPMSAEDRAAMAKLQALDGRAFDAAFLKAMDEGHKKAIALLDTAQDRTGDPRVDRLVGRLLPILRQHRELSQHLQGGA